MQKEQCKFMTSKTPWNEKGNDSPESAVNNVSTSVRKHLHNLPLRNNSNESWQKVGMKGSLFMVLFLAKLSPSLKGGWTTGAISIKFSATAYINKPNVIVDEVPYRNHSMIVTWKTWTLPIKRKHEDRVLILPIKRKHEDVLAYAFLMTRPLSWFGCFDNITLIVSFILVR